MIALTLLAGISASTPLVTPPLPTLPEAFGSGTAGAGAVAPGQGLFRRELPRDRYPEARCADGSPAVVYVRRASDPIHRDDWVVYLQGGGSCENGQDCHERWLGRDGNFGANKLSSRYAPKEGIAAGGIQGTDERNPFARWNHVFAYYCSSDGWAGQAANITTEAVHEGSTVSYRIDQLGARIVDGTFDWLRSGTASYVDAQGKRIALADLDQAKRVLFTGSSAGGSGVRSHADRIGDLLRRHNRQCQSGSCPLQYAAVIDASFGAGTESFDHTNSRACGPTMDGTCTYENAMRLRWFDVLLGFRNGLADQSCVDYHTPRGDEWRCADGVHVLQHHVGSPFFIRADLQDRLVMGNTVEAGYQLGGVEIDPVAYGYFEEAQLRALATIDQRSEEPRTWTPQQTPGVFGPQCGDHETLRSDAPTYGRVLRDPAGNPYRMLDVLANWLDGRTPNRLIGSFDPAGPSTDCRATGR